jgi:peptidoglycan-associated lipoprotein
LAYEDVMFAPESVASHRPLVAAFVLLTLVTADAIGPLRADSVSEPEWAQQPSHSRAYGSEQRAQELYLDGVEKLEAGHGDWARTTFESVIAQYPSSAAAEDARRQLGALYQANSAAGSSEDSDVLPPVVVPTAPAIAPLPPVPPPALHAGRGPAWEQELRRNSAIQSKLRREAGDRVFFSAGSAELGSRARSALAAQAVWLKRWHEFEAAIEGHADEPGSDRDNLDLSLQRAQAVRQRLIEEGVDASRVAVVPLGRTERLASCEEPDCRAQNRRSVTLVFASGTRGRLNLTDAPQAQLVDRPAAALVAPRAAEIPTGAPPAGVTR